MTTYYLNNTQIEENSDITLNGMIYPYSWLEGASPSVLTSYGIHKNTDVLFDEKYFYSVGNPKELDDSNAVDEHNNPLYVKIYDEETKEMIDSSVRMVNIGLKNICLREIKNKTNTLLSPTDFNIIRNHVEDTEIPASVITYRNAVITESVRLQNEISEVTTVDELIELMNSAAFQQAE